MKLILIAKSDLNDKPNHDGTITLGETFKMHALAFDDPTVKNVEDMCQKILLLKKRPKVPVYPTNFYAIGVCESGLEDIRKQLKQLQQNQGMILVVTIPSTQFNLIGYIQFLENNQYKVVINADCRNLDVLKAFKELAKKLTHIEEDKMHKHALGYCNRVEHKFLNAKNNLASKSTIYKHPKTNFDSKKPKTKSHHTKSSRKK